jgi:hypothetical protein
MNALRQIVNAENHFVKLELPPDFPQKNLEIIIIPVDELEEDQKNKKISRAEFFGRWKGQIKMSPDFDDPLDDFREYME